MAKPDSFLAKLKKQIAASGQSKKGFWYVKEGQKRRIRFIKGGPKDKGTDLEKGITIPWHSKWEGSRAVVDSPCLSQYGKDCPFCGVEDVKLRERFAWTIYDYESKEAQIFLFYANRNSPITHLAASYDEWGTVCDRDLTIARNGTGTDTTYTIIAGTPSKFRFAVNPFSVAKILDMTWKAFGTGKLDEYPDEGSEDSDEEDYEEEDETEDDSDEEEEAEEDYEDDDDEEEEVELPRKRAVKAVPAKKPIKKVRGRS